MRISIVFILSCASVFGADTSIRVVSIAATNGETGSISTRDVFTRDGQTNLVRNTKTTDGVVQTRIHRFYHDGSLVGEFVAMPDSSWFTTEAGTPYSVGFEFGPSKDVKSAAISTKDGVLLDAFPATNGLFCPADVLLIGKANDIGGDVRKLLSPQHITNSAPGEFQQEVEQLIEKHKDK